MSKPAYSIMQWSRHIRLVLVLMLLFAASSGMFLPRVAAQSSPTATTDPATGIGASTATVNGTVNANGESTTVTFEYGLTTSYGGTFTADQSPVTGTTGTAVSVMISELAPNTTYHFRVVATNASGTAYGADMTFTTTPPPPAALTTAATAVTTSGATLNGIVNARGESTTVTFEYGLDTSYGTTVTADQSPVTGAVSTAVSKAITGLTINTTYHYRAVASNAYGTTYGQDMSFYTGATPPAPTATTNAASGVTDTGATLNGTVNANDLGTIVTFEYGLDAGYGSIAIAPQSPVTGTTAISVSAMISDLSPGTTYHFRVVATNLGGTTYGADITFTTSSPAAPTATTNAASSVGASSAILNGMVNANGYSATVAFEYGLTAAYGTTVTADQSPVSGATDTAVDAIIAGLSPNTTYHFRVVATNAGGTTNGADMTFTTGLTPTATTGAATAVGSSTATLNGTVNAGDESTTVTFEYGEDTGYGHVVGADQSPVTGSTDTVVSRAITGLLPNTTYYFRVVAQNASRITYGTGMTFTTTAAPTTVTGVASPVSTSGATLNGTVNANNDSTTVTFEYGLTTSYGTTVTADQSPVTGSTDTAVSKAITGLTIDTTYHYRVVATNGNGTTYGADMTFVTSAPAAPTATTDPASFVLFDGATLNGTVNANNADATVTFQYGPTAAYGTEVPADQSPVSGAINTAVSRAITGLALNTTYHYRVVAANANGTVYGGDMTFTTGPGPSAVTHAASGVGSASATLNGVVNANYANATVTFEHGLTTGYGSTATAEPDTVSGNTNTLVSATITGLLPNTTYHFRVVAEVLFVGTAYGADMTFTTGPAVTAVTNPATAVGSSTATLNGTVNAGGESGTVTFQFGTDTSYGRTVTADQSPVTGSTNTAVSATASDLAPNTTYHHRVVIQSALETVYGADMTFTTGGVPPAATTDAASGVTASAATLNGTVNANNDSTTVTFEYGLTTSYGTTVTADQSPVTGGSNTGVSKTITGLANGTTYHYRVVAQNGFGTTYGEDMTFTTGGVPTATTDAASGITTSEATLRGTVNAAGNSTTVFFEYGPDTDYDRTVPADQSPVTGTADTSVSAALSTLANGTTYHYRVVAQSPAGTVYGADMTFTTGILPPGFGKGFAPNPIIASATSTLSFTIDNSASGVAASGLDVTDNLPAGLVIANPTNASTTCTGGALTAVAGTGTLSYTDGTLSAGATCTIQVDVTATTAGWYANTSGDLTSSSGNSGPASDTLRVNPPPLFSKSFAPDPAVVGGVSTLSFSIDNTSSTAEATDLDFTDTLPAGLVVASPANESTTCSGGTLTAAAGTSVVAYTDGMVSTGATCTVQVDVTCNTSGGHANTSGDLTSSLGNSGPANDTLTVNPQPGFGKSFAPDPAVVGGISTLSFTIDNTDSTVDATDLDFTDNLPASLLIANPANASTTCTGGTLTAVAGTSVISYTGGTVSAGATCTVQVDVTSDTDGYYANTSGDLTSSLGNSGPASDTLAVLNLDFGDAPDPSYPTLLANTGASHVLGSNVYLGYCVDAEGDGQPSSGADGDDLNSGSPVYGGCARDRDEEGVAFPAPLYSDAQADVLVTANTTCTLSAWLDFSGDGDWADGDEDLFPGGRTIAPGINNLTITVPPGAQVGNTYARFRCTTDGAVSFTGSASDGEVEDYQVAILPPPADLGDAPDPSYPTLLASTGASHRLGSDVYLGSCVDGETDGQPSPDADGDDASVGSSLFGACAGNDDEDGVTFASALLAGGTTDIEVTANTTCTLSAWIDFSGDGDWADAGEDLFPGGQALAPGANPLSVTVPAGAVEGNTYARFRCTTDGAVTFTGEASDGEVEDYYVGIGPALDLGDAPDPDYPTFLSSTGASHVLGSNVYLGSCVDAESDGQPTPGADGDDVSASNPAFGTCREGDDDEDGVILTSLLVAGETANVQVTANEACTLSGWIDFTGDGDWADTGEDLFPGGQPLAAGANDLTFAVPAGAELGDTYARFRCTTDGAVTFTGEASDGEVEDYRVRVGALDLGDAPDPNYPTLRAHTGASHRLGSNVYLGSCVDAESDGQPTPSADGDDVGVGSLVVGTCTNDDDEDGVIFTSVLNGGQTAGVDVTASTTCTLSAWIDFSADGDWADAGEDLFPGGELLAPGVNSLSFAVPAGAARGSTYARFRCTTDGAVPFTGEASDGEVEDHHVRIGSALDLGDAPDPGYPTLLASAGANHLLGSDVYLGSCVDADVDGQPVPGANGDDANPSGPIFGTCQGGDDEDGVAFLDDLVRGETVDIEVTASTACTLSGWIDFNADGDWMDAGEDLFPGGQLLASGVNPLAFAVPPGAVLGDTYARFRCTTDGAVPFTGQASDGEVEDYQVTVWALTYLPLAMRNYVIAPDLMIEEITVTHDNITAVIRNVGNGPVTDEFWVDAYINPDTAPTAVNQIWNDLGDEGVVWGVTAAALPLAPGDVLTLTVGDAYYMAAYSEISWPLAAGTQVYAQVDSWDGSTSYGSVRESHEMTGEPYNNISGPVEAAANTETLSPPAGSVTIDLPHLTGSSDRGRKYQ